jgi:hypothetical protein
LRPDGHAMMRTTRPMNAENGKKMAMQKAA